MLCQFCPAAMGPEMSCRLEIALGQLVSGCAVEWPACRQLLMVAPFSSVQYSQMICATNSTNRF